MRPAICPYAWPHRLLDCNAEWSYGHMVARIGCWIAKTAAICPYTCPHDFLIFKMGKHAGIYMPAWGSGNANGHACGHETTVFQIFHQELIQTSKKLMKNKPKSLTTIKNMKLEAPRGKLNQRASNNHGSTWSNKLRKMTNYTQTHTSKQRTLKLPNTPKIRKHSCKEF